MVAKEEKQRGSAAGSKKKLSYKDQREFDSMEQRILEAEAEVERLEGEAADPALATDHERATRVYAALSAAQESVAAMYARWEELEGLQG